VTRKGALHYSCGQRTTHHAHYAWKIHVGIDAPVWLTSPECSISTQDRARVVVAPPGVGHSTGAVGWSCAVFVAPGSHATGWRATSHAYALGGLRAQKIVDAARHYDPDDRASTPAFLAELAKLGLSTTSAPGIDRRVEHALALVADDPDRPLPELARRVGTSLDRLSRLVTRDTGMHLRKHVLWTRLLRVLSSSGGYPNVAAAALDAGFADHAHMTRTYRTFLGRVPSDFQGPPDLIAPW